MRFISRNTVILVILSYFLVQALGFSLFKTGADIDTAELMLYIQSWEWGYGGSQPPFFNWFARLVTLVFGVNLFVLSLAKFAFLALALVFLWLSAERLGLGVSASLLAVLGIFLMPELGWETQRSLTHSIPMLAFCGVGFFCFLVASQSRSWGAYVGFGLAFALAVMSKYNGGLFFAAVLLGGLTSVRYRSVVLSWRMLVALGVTALCVAPHLRWALSNIPVVLQRSDKFARDAGADPWQVREQGLVSFLEALISVAGPIVIIGALVLLVQRLRGGRAVRDPALDVVNLPLRVVGVGLVLVIASVLIGGSGDVLNRWLSPVLLLFPMGVAVWLEQRSHLRVIGVLSGLGAVFAVLYAVALPLSITMADDDASRRSMLDYDRFWDSVTAQHPRICRVLTNEYAVFGNLKLVEPELEISHSVYAPGGPVPGCATLLAWRGTGDVPAAFALEAGYQVEQRKVARVDDPTDVTVMRFVVLDN